MAQHRDRTDRPARDAARVIAGHTLTLWDRLVGDLPKGSQTRRDVAWVAGFVISMIVLIVFSVLVLGDWTSAAPESIPKVRETVTVTVPVPQIAVWCTQVPCLPPTTAPLPIPVPIAR